MSTKLSPQDLYKKLGHITYGTGNCVYNQSFCEKACPTVNEILALKEEKNALILAHSYITPDIIAAVSDFSGDSYELSKKAKATNADIIVFVAVKFMAETAKILNPNKQVLIPARDPGCSLADSINASTVSKLRERYPDYTFVCYINTTAAVKALCDVCVTSSNVNHIIRSIPNKNIYFLPDKLMAENVMEYLKTHNIDKNFKYYDGTCYVHEAYDPSHIEAIRISHPEALILAHPECNAGVVQHADFCGSTSQMIRFVKESTAESFYLLTECGLSARLQMEIPHKQFVGSCSICKYMKSNSLDSIKEALLTPQDFEVNVDSETINKAQACLGAMFTYAS